ncbi:MAG: hypothetical protein Q8M66_09390 [Actinomycetota bacterium]|nr:hypothetical protein [Actinomycetota bacterium]MDZ4180858.1 hypothetical protein [Coriobacteriia bacterium]
MSVNRPDVTDEDIGMRAFQIRKAKAVERATERIRHALKQDWPSLTSPEIEELEWVLGELWAYIARDDWDSLRFGLLSMLDLRKILKLGRELRKHSRNAVEVLTDVGQIIRERG